MLLNEVANTKKYVVIRNYGRGRQTILPSNENPALYSEEEAERIVKKETKEERSTRSKTHMKTLDQALNVDNHYVTKNSKAWMALLKLEDELYGNDE